MPPSESPKTFFDEKKNLYILLKSAHKLQEMPFQRSKFQNGIIKPIYFAQNAGNAISETQISKNFQGTMLPDSPTIVSSLWPPPH